MTEIERSPIIDENKGLVIFDDEHSFADIIRYLLSEGCSAEEIIELTRRYSMRYCNICDIAECETHLNPKPKWHWYSGPNDESFTNGPFDTKEAAVGELDGYPGYVIEAFKVDILLAHYFDAGDFLENAEENAYELANEYCEPIFDITPAQIADLEAVVREAMNGWQRKHNLRFVPWYFTNQRNLEYINGEMDDPGQPGPETDPGAA